MELVILHVTDTHLCFDKIAQLKQWLMDRNQRVDLVLLSGDIANLSDKTYGTAPLEEVEKHDKFLEQIVKQLSTIATVYYIPGNHDSINTYSPESQPARNLHMRSARLADCLLVVGVGGSVPGYLEADGSQVWAGFPYSSDESYGEDLSKVLDPMFGLHGSNTQLQQQDAVILMTHVGPHKSCTTFSRLDVGRGILSGSPTLLQYLNKQELQHHTVMNIHGHTHDAPGHTTIGRVTVSNPGPLLCGQFGVYSLLRDESCSPVWRISSLCYHKLPRVET